jgi:hypothetical protein
VSDIAIDKATQGLAEPIEVRNPETGPSVGAVVQWQLMDDDAANESTIVEGRVLRSVVDKELLNDDGSPVETLLISVASGQWQVLRPFFREEDYGMVWFEIRGPVGTHENPAAFKASDKRLRRMGPVRWRHKQTA